jgi:glycosyltransferase involved in cell wall biosynthesis
MTIELSVIVCTYDRPQLLGQALKSLCAQSIEPSRYEVIVVDNAGDDQTQRLVREQQAANEQHNICMIHEPQVGASRARTTGMKSAQADLIGFVDDDAKAAPDWAQRVLECFENESAASCVGGPILPFYTSEKPVWFKDEYESWQWGTQARQLLAGEAFVGSNMIWRRQALDDIGSFPTELGPHGNRFAMGEDTLMFQQLWAHNQQAICWYDPKLVVRHWVPSFKMHVRYRLLRHFGSGGAHGRICRHSGLIASLGHLVWSVVVLPVHFILALLSILKYKHRQQWLVEAWEGFARRCGMIVGLLGIKVTLRQPNE